MRKLFATVVVVLLAGLSLRAAAATPQEDAYIVARDKYLKHFEKDAPANTDAAKRDEDRAIADLKTQLEVIIGPVNVKGVDSTRRNNIDTLTSGDDTFGHLDGLAFGPFGNRQMILVTTDALLKNWLKLHETWWGKEESRMPQVPSAALKTEGFYTQAIGIDAAFMFYAELPIIKPRSASFAVAYLHVTAQDFGPWKPNQILVSVMQGGKLFIASMAANTPVPAIAACDAIWHAAEKKSGEAKADFDDVRKKGDADFHRCFAARAKSEAFFAKLTAQAQRIADGLPAK